MRKWQNMREDPRHSRYLLKFTNWLRPVSTTCVLPPLERLQMTCSTKQNHINPLSPPTPPPDHECRHYILCVCVCDFPLTMSPGQWPPTNVNHGSNDAGRVHEEVVSPVLPVLVNLTGPGTSVIPPWGGKNTAGLGTQCVCDHRRTSNRHFMHVHGCRRTEELCSCKSSRFQGLFFLSFLLINEHYDAAVYPYPGGYVKH